MPRINVDTAPDRSGTRYPEEYAEPVRARRWKALGDAAGLTQFGVNLVILDPGVWSSQRHWHSHEDEFVYVLTGALTLVTDAGEETLEPGDCAGFPAGVKDGHVLQNRSEAPATILVVGSRDDRDFGEYPDIDMKFLPGRYGTGGGFTRKDGTPFD